MVTVLQCLTLGNTILMGLRQVWLLLLRQAALVNYELPVRNCKKIPLADALSVYPTIV